VARLGGDEFAVLLPDITHASAAIVDADKPRAALERPFHIKGLGLMGSSRCTNWRSASRSPST